MEDTNTEPNKKRKADEITEDGDAQDAGKANAKTDGGDAVSNNVKEERQEQDDGADNDAKDDTPAVDKADAPVETAEDSKKPADTAEKEKNDVAPARKPNNYDKLKYVVVTNDGRDESLIKLVGLKSLFAKQLPKMPRAYIARLVFDRNHVSLAILNEDPSVKDSDEEIIGAICYRPFKDMRFAEIAFCAVNATHQVKGYGTKLMNLVKQKGAEDGIEYFITYADNYAIGYFKKQGFVKTSGSSGLAMHKGRHKGLIKDYDGGTMMECYVHPSIDFTRINEMIDAQKQFIMDRIRIKANSHKVYDPLPKGFDPITDSDSSRSAANASRIMAIPGIAEAGWTLEDLKAGVNPSDGGRQKSALKSEMLAIVRKIEEQQFAWPFREPVDTTEVTDYLDVVKNPIDLSTIEKRIQKGNHYKSKKMLYSDLMLMVNNCKLYNQEGSTYVQCAVSLERFLSNIFVDM